MNKKFYFIAVPALLLLTLFSSCEKEANVKLPPTPPKLVMISFITPQDNVVSATLTYSKPIFQSSTVDINSPVDDATVTLSGNSTSVQLTYNSTSGTYTIPTSQFSIIAGNTYTLSATRTNSDAVSATTTVPSHNVTGFSVTETDSLSGSGYQQLDTKFHYQINDNAGETNWYRFFAAVILRDTMTSDTTLVPCAAQLFTDQNIDGQQSNENANGGWGNYYSINSLIPIGYDCWIFNANKDYYQFHNSIENYGGDSPFAEPTLIYTNVKGGLGVFAAANGNKIRIYR